MINKIDKRAEENRKSFATTSRGIHQPAFIIDNMLPGLLLKWERLQPFGVKPLFYYFISFCMLKIHGGRQFKEYYLAVNFILPSGNIFYLPDLLSSIFY